MVAAAREFFGECSLPRFHSASYIALIPKVEKPFRFDKFSPISLCSVIYMVFSKILVKRLSPILSRIVSQNKMHFY